MALTHRPRHRRSPRRGPRRLLAAAALLGAVVVTANGPGEPPPAVAAAAPAASLAEPARDLARAARAVVASPPAPVGARTMGRSVPLRLQVPAIGLDTGLTALGLLPDGSLQVPADGFPAGWYTGAPTPGERGPAVLAGHVDWNGSAAVFADLHRVRPGDRVLVTRADGTTAVFRVTRRLQSPKSAFPTAAVYGDVDHAGLRLITCGGTFDRRQRSYRDNVVVFAELVDARTA